ncbi:MAG: hypothetical protein ACREV1_07835 [Gammaproteobacteria bacterium]
MGAIIFIALFTGPIGDKRFVWITRFSYFFTIAALLASVLPFFLLKEVGLKGEALGIAVGCAEGNGEDRELPSEILCDDKEHPNRFWLVNIGGAAKLVKQSANEGGGAASAPSIVKITGGLVIPLYVLVLALMGAAVSMTRRVPEYQMRVTEANGIHIRNKQLVGRSKREPISFARARELMVFQIMQVVSAPMIALTAYYLILPDTRTTSVVIAFVSGFASETILRLLRGAADGLTAKLDAAKTDAPA